MFFANPFLFGPLSLPVVFLPTLAKPVGGESLTLSAQLQSFSASVSAARQMRRDQQRNVLKHRNRRRAATSLKATGVAGAVKTAGDHINIYRPLKPIRVRPQPSPTSFRGRTAGGAGGASTAQVDIGRAAAQTARGRAASERATGSWQSSEYDPGALVAGIAANALLISFLLYGVTNLVPEAVVQTIRKHEIDQDLQRYGALIRAAQSAQDGGEGKGVFYNAIADSLSLPAMADRSAPPASTSGGGGQGGDDGPARPHPVFSRYEGRTGRPVTATGIVFASRGDRRGTTSDREVLGGSFIGWVLAGMARRYEEGKERQLAMVANGGGGISGDTASRRSLQPIGGAQRGSAGGAEGFKGLADIAHGSARSPTPQRNRLR